MTIQGQAVCVTGNAEPAPLPKEIEFLSRHGVQMNILQQAAKIAAEVGVTADEAALKNDLLDEVTFYKALADELRVPFLTEVRIDERARFPESILAGLAPLAPGSGAARYAVAPARNALVHMLAGGPKIGSDLAITTPTALREGVLRARPRAIAWHAANDLPEVNPEWSVRDGSSWLQICWATALSGVLSVVANLAPSSTLMVVMALSGIVFLGMVVLRLAATRERVAVEPGRGWSRYDDRDLPVYTLIIALHRERRVLARLIDALLALDYPGVMAQTPQANPGDRPT